MRTAALVLIISFGAACFGQQTGHVGSQQNDSTITVSGCLMNMNGSFKLLSHGEPVYKLQGDHNSLFSYNGMLVTVTGTIKAADKQLPRGVPVILHVAHLKKLADTCH